MSKILTLTSCLILACSQPPLSNQRCILGEIREFCTPNYIDKTILECELWHVDQQCKKIEPAEPAPFDEEIESESVRQQLVPEAESSGITRNLTKQI